MLKTYYWSTLLYLLLFFSKSLGCYAQVPPITITDSISENIYPLKALEYFEDRSNELSFKDISSPLFSDQFKINPHYSNYHYSDSATYWIRISLKHDPDTKKSWLIEFYDQTIDHIEAYQPDGKGNFTRAVMGDLQIFDQRYFPHKNFEIALENHQDLRTYYFKVKSHGFADIRIALRSTDRFIYYALNEYMLFGLFYGMIIILSLYNLLMYLAIREIKYLYYIFYLLSVGFYVMCIDGTAFQYLWPNSPQWNQIAYGVFLYSIILWSLLFSQRFLNTKTKAPILHKAITYVVLVRSLIFLMAIFYTDLFTFRAIEFVPFVIIFFASIYVLAKGYKPARFFVMAYGLLFLGFFIKALVNSGILPVTIFSNYSLHLSFLLEMLFLSLALGDRVRILKRNRDLAQLRIIKEHELNVRLKNQINRELESNVALKDKVNKELEQKVKERTLELNDKNKLLEEYNLKLLQQATEINRINSMLDLDNWKLKNNIRESLVDRFLNKKLNLEDFKKIFPDKLACYRYLEKIKWKDGFECKKCENDRYFDGIKKFSRRCTKCGYNESITAYTIFHGIKFPLEKAFYITYIVMSNNKAITLEGLSQQLALRMNTVWSFKNKINKSFTGIKGTNEDWKNFLLEPPISNQKDKKKNKQLH